MINGFLLILICVASSAIGSICLKQMSEVTSKSNVMDLIYQPLLWVGAFFYFFSFVAYAYAIKVLPLSFVQPIVTAGVTLLVSLLAVILFKESIQGLHLLGLGLILVGLMLITYQ